MTGFRLCDLVLEMQLKEFTVDERNEVILEYQLTKWKYTVPKECNPQEKRMYEEEIQTKAYIAGKSKIIEIIDGWHKKNDKIKYYG